jgi:hypothetical protein
MNVVSTLTTCINDLHTHLEGLEHNDEGDIVNLHIFLKKDMKEV